jgi:hypothetical protein
MVSSSFCDLKELRRKIIDLTRPHDLHAVAMEDSTARPTLDTRSSSLQMVDTADAYIGIIGYRYGSRTPPDDVSLTELEWRRARQRGIPRSFLVMSGEYAVRLGDMEMVRDADRESLAAFRKQVEADVVCAHFKDSAHFEVMAMGALVELRRSLDELHQTHTFAMLSSTPGPCKPASRNPWQDDAHLELLCDRIVAVKAFEDELLYRPDPLRPGCLVVFGEVDQAHGDFFERIKSHTLSSAHYRKRYGEPETVHVPFERAFYQLQEDISVHILRTALGQIDGNVDCWNLVDLFGVFYKTLKRRKVELCLINCFVHLESHAEARWWIERFRELRQQLQLEQDGPQVILSVAIQYPRGRWLLRRSRDLTRFFRQHFPAAFADLLRDSGVGQGIETFGIKVRRLSSVTQVHVSQWCEEPQVRPRIERARISRQKFLQPFERSGEQPMWDVLEHLRAVLRNHPA